MPELLATIVVALAEGQSAEAVLAGLTAANWGTLIAGIGAVVAPEIGTLLGIKSVSIGTLVEGVVKAAGDDVIKQKMRDWVSANADMAMQLQPGMGPH